MYGIDLIEGTQVTLLTGILLEWARVRYFMLNVHNVHWINRGKQLLFFHAQLRDNAFTDNQNINSQPILFHSESSNSVFLLQTCLVLYFHGFSASLIRYSGVVMHAMVLCNFSFVHVYYVCRLFLLFIYSLLQNNNLR